MPWTKGNTASPPAIFPLPAPRRPWTSCWQRITLWPWTRLEFDFIGKMKCSDYPALQWGALSDIFWVNAIKWRKKHLWFLPASLHRGMGERQDQATHPTEHPWDCPLSAERYQHEQGWVWVCGKPEALQNVVPPLVKTANKSVFWFLEIVQTRLWGHYQQRIFPPRGCSVREGCEGLQGHHQWCKWIMHAPVLSQRASPNSTIHSFKVDNHNNTKKILKSLFNAVFEDCNRSFELKKYTFVIALWWPTGIRHFVRGCLISD